MIRLIFLIVFIVSFGFGFSQNEIQVEFDRNSMRLGEQTTLKLKVAIDENKKNLSVLLPQFDKEIPVQRADTNLSGKLEVIDSFVDTINDINSGTQTLEQNYIITAWDTGIFVIDSLQIKIDDSIYYPNSAFIRIGDVPVDTTKDIVDIKDIYSAEANEEESEEGASWWSKNWIWITIVAVLLIAGIVGWFLYFRKKQDIIEVKAKLPAHQIALQRLGSLKKKDYLKKGQEKEYYSEITDIIRIYLEDRFDVKALELTTNEIISRLKYTNIAPDDKFALREIMETADLVKFAKMKPNEMDNENTIYKAEEFVRHTKLKPTESEEETTIKNLSSDTE